MSLWLFEDCMKTKLYGPEMVLNSEKNAWQWCDVESRGWLETSIRSGYMTTVMWQVAHSNNFSRMKHLYVCHIWTGGSDFRRLSNKIEQFPHVCKQMQVHACNLLVWVGPNIVWYRQSTLLWLGHAFLPHRLSFGMIAWRAKRASALEVIANSGSTCTK